MFDIGWSEMAIIMLLALIIIGPKDLPRVARTIGQWVRKGRMLAREFQTSLEDMAKETELDDVRKEIEKVGRTDLKKTVENTIDPKGELSKAFDVSTSDAKPALSNDKGDGGEKATSAGTANGQAVTKTETDGASKDGAAAAKARPSAKTSAKAKPARKAAKTPATTRKPAAAKKPASSAKKTAKPAASAKSAAAARSAASAKRGTEPASGDDGSGDRTAMAAKPS